MTSYSSILGPAFLYWVAQLDAKLCFLSETRGYKALHCARAGKRIDDFLRAYSGGETRFPSELFGISRIGACKLAVGDSDTFSTAYNITAASLHNVTLADVCRAYLQHVWDERDPNMAALARLNQPFTHDSFRALIAANDANSRFFRDMLLENRKGMRAWLSNHLDGANGYVLVDSGWQASMQKLLNEVYPEFGFMGLYFGVMDETPMTDRFGIVFDAPNYCPERPETAFAIHRHLIETILEPNAPSVEEVLGGPHDAIAREQLNAVRDETPDAEQDRLFLELLEYVGNHADMPLDEIVLQYHKSLPEIANRLIYPSREDALALAGKNRSIDFGRQGAVAVVHDADERTPDSRIQSSLWPQGQIALEYTGDTARALQEKVTAGHSTDYFTGHETSGRSPKAASIADKKPEHWHGSVAIVTRTKDRPLLFKRAARSVASQTWDNFQWVIVNDGGDVEPVRAIISRSGVDPRKITLVSNPESVGMEAASNMGVRAVDTEFVVIHDDDDCWEPTFLEESIEFLQTPRAAMADFEGVVSRAWRVSEQIKDDEVIFHGREPFMSWVSEVPLSQMAAGNFFAPISFLYRRSVYDDIGGYDERLPVLGDWRFNLDFLVRANIGFLDRYLSHYHHRDMGDSTRDGVYANSVVGGQGLHAQYFSVVTNGILRSPETPEALRQVVANAHQQRVFEMNFSIVRDAISSLSDDVNQDTRAAGTRILEDDFDFIRKSVRHALPFTLVPRKLAKRLYWELRLAFERRPSRVEIWLPRLLPLISSPPSFNHIAYLSDHPDIWATPFNGFDELLPYHHYLLQKLRTKKDLTKYIS